MATVKELAETIVTSFAGAGMPFTVVRSSSDSATIAFGSVEFILDGYTRRGRFSLYVDYYRVPRPTASTCAQWIQQWILQELPRRLKQRSEADERQRRRDEIAAFVSDCQVAADLSQMGLEVNGGRASLSQTTTPKAGAAVLIALAFLRDPSASRRALPLLRELLSNPDDVATGAIMADCLEDHGGSLELIEAVRNIYCK